MYFLLSLDNVFSANVMETSRNLLPASFLYIAWISLGAYTNWRTFSQMTGSSTLSFTASMSSSIDFTSSLRELVNILRTINDLAKEMAITRTVGVNFGHQTVVPGKGRERLRRRLHSPIRRKKKSKVRTSYHCNRIADLQCGFEHEIRHVPMYALQSSQ